MSELDKKLEEIVQNPLYKIESSGRPGIRDGHAVHDIDGDVQAIKQAFIDDGWSKPSKAKNKSDMERILAVIYEAYINDIRILAISTPMYTTKELATTQLGTTLGIDHVIGMVHQPMYYKMLDDKRGVMTKEEWEEQAKADGWVRKLGDISGMNIVVDPKLMTGQEWYDRFNEHFEALSRTDEGYYRPGDVYDAAKKASGIE